MEMPDQETDKPLVVEADASTKTESTDKKKVEETTKPTETPSTAYSYTNTSGGTQDIPKATADYLIGVGYDKLQEEERNKNNPTPDTSDDDLSDHEKLVKRQDALEQKLQATQADLQGQRAINRLQTEVVRLTNNSEFLKENPDLVQELNQEIYVRVAANANKPIAQQFAEVETKFKKIQTDAITNYSKKKVSDAADTQTTRGSSGGVPLPDKPITGEDIMSGAALKLLKRTLQQ